MYTTTIRKWGNSRAIRLPKMLLEKAKLKNNDELEIKVGDGNILIIPVKKHKRLAGRLAEYKGDYQCGEWDTGKAKGKEVW